MAKLLPYLHWICGLVVLAEALNKLERTAPRKAGLCSRQRLVAWLKAIAWLLLALGGAGAIAGPIFRTHPPALADVCLLAGFAVLIVRTRFKEG